MMVPNATKQNAECKISIGDKRDFSGKGGASVFANYTAIIKCHDELGDLDSKIKAKSCGNRVFDMVADTSHCGAYSYTLKHVWFYDYLGLFCFPKICNNSHILLVRPTPSMPNRIPDVEGAVSRTLRKSNSQYSEIYDLRDYMSGDSVKNIHWKMSAKKDSILVKEPLEEENGNARLGFELVTSRDEMDKKLGEILFISNLYLQKEIHHQVSIMCEGREISFLILSYEDIERMIDEILKVELPKEAVESGKRSKSQKASKSSKSTKSAKSSKVSENAETPKTRKAKVGGDL